MHQLISVSMAVLGSLVITTIASSPAEGQKLPLTSLPGYYPPDFSAPDNKLCSLNNQALPAPAAPAPLMFHEAAQPPQTDGNGNSLQTCQSYPDGPVTDVAGSSTFVFERSNWVHGLWPEVYVNRTALRNDNGAVLGPNLITPQIVDPTGKSIGLEFFAVAGDIVSPVAKADAVTKAEVLRILGAAPQVWEAPLLDAGFPVGDPNSSGACSPDPDAFLICYSALKAAVENNSGGSFFNFSNNPNSHDGKYYVLQNKMVVHDEDPNWIYSQTGSSGPTGVVLDYESQDFRTPNDAYRTITRLGQAIRTQRFTGISNGRDCSRVACHPKVYVYTNPLFPEVAGGPRNGAFASNGWSYSTIRQTLQFVDYISILPNVLDQNGVAGAACSTSAPNHLSAFELSVNFLGTNQTVPPYSKIIVTFDAARCNSINAHDLYNARKLNPFAGYAIFTKGGYVTRGGNYQNPLNVDIWQLLYGTEALPH